VVLVASLNVTKTNFIFLDPEYTHAHTRTHTHIGTSFTGNLENPIPASDPPVYPHKWPIYVRGGRIVTAVVNFLMKQHGMSDATDIIVTGGSSGGMATYLNCDRIADQVHATNPNIRVTCLADAGMFLDHPGISGQPVTTFRSLLLD
jgi:hypothetical protein